MQSRAASSPPSGFLEKIWGYDTEAEMQRGLGVHLLPAQKAGRPAHADIQIKARRNAGYYLEEGT